MDATIVAPPSGLLPSEQELVFQFDDTGNLVQPCLIWSNAELNPQNSSGLGTYYLVSLYDVNGARVSQPMWWQFPNAAGATVDISFMTALSTIGGNVIFYPDPSNIFNGNVAIGQLNNTVYVDGVRFTTIAQAVAFVMAGPTGCGTVVTPPGYRETITAQITLGTSNTSASSKAVMLYLGKDTLLTGDVRNGTDSIFLVNAGSGIVGLGGPQGNANRVGGCVIQLAQTASVANIINTPGSTNNSFFCTLQNFFLDGGARSGAGTAVISNACLNLIDILNLSTISDIAMIQFQNCIGLNVTADNFTSGPVLIENVWVEGLQLAGARPAVITSHLGIGTHSNQGISWVGGVINGSGTGLANLEINGNGEVNHTQASILLNGVYFECSSGTNNIGIKIRDACNVNIVSCTVSLSGVTTGTAIDISQSGAGLVRAIQIIGFKMIASAAVAINNHISGESIGTSTVFIPTYFYGDDNAGSRKTIGPIFSNPKALIVGKYNSAADNAADLVIVPASPASRAPFLIKNFANNTLTVKLDSGLNAGQETHIEFLDQGTSEWYLRKSTGNDFVIQDNLNVFNAMVFTQGGAIAINAFTGAPNAVTINSNANSGAAGLAVYSGGASPLVVASLNSNGLIINNAAATHIVGQIAQNGNSTLRNWLDQSTIFALDSGLTTTQDLYIALRDQGTEEWRVGKNGSNNLYIEDVINTKNRMVFVQSAHPAEAGVLRLANAEAISWRNQASGADLSISYDSSNDLAISPNIGFGNGSAGTAVTTTTKGTGSGPATAETVIGYMAVNIAGVGVRYIPYFL